MKPRKLLHYCRSQLPALMLCLRQAVEIDRLQEGELLRAGRQGVQQVLKRHGRGGSVPNELSLQVQVTAPPQALLQLSVPCLMMMSESQLVPEGQSEMVAVPDSCGTQ